MERINVKYIWTFSLLFLLFSANVVFAATSPQNLQATAISSTAISLSWEDSTSDTEKIVRIERKTGRNSGFKVDKPVYDNLIKNKTSHTDGGIASNTEYCYRILFNNDVPNYSNEACATTAPSDVAAVPFSAPMSDPTGDSPPPSSQQQTNETLDYKNYNLVVHQIAYDGVDHPMLYSGNQESAVFGGVIAEARQRGWEYILFHQGEDYTEYLKPRANSSISQPPVQPASSAPTRSVRVAYPNGGEDLEEGRTARIMWDVVGDIGSKVFVQLVQANGEELNIGYVANIGVYDWQVGYTGKGIRSGQGFRIKVTGDGAVDTSDGKFSILAPQTTQQSWPSPAPASSPTLSQNYGYSPSVQNLPSPTPAPATPISAPSPRSSTPQAPPSAPNTPIQNIPENHVDASAPTESETTLSNPFAIPTAKAVAPGVLLGAGIRAAAVLGIAGEKASGVAKNTERIVSLSGSAKYRIPDALNHITKTIGEVKNVAYQALTKQIGDFVSYAESAGYEFTLYVRSNTILSKPLQNLIDTGKVLLNKF